VTRVSAKEVTIGIDIGTTAVKAVAADEDGKVVARSRIPHQLLVPAPENLEHDADEAWRRGPLTALAELDRPDATAVAVTAMVPSLTAVDDVGRPLTPGLLYGDRRGRGPASTDNTVLSGEAVEFLRWTAREAPDAKGYWPATALANHALSGEAVLDHAGATTMYPLFDGTDWSEERCAECGVTADRLPRVERTGAAVGRLRDSGAVLGAGSADALCEQLVAGADRDGDVVVLCGTTLIVWITIPEYREAPGLWTLPHPAAGKFQIGGPSNAGGLFLGWVNQLVAEDNSQVDPGRVPVWSPYVRGERTPHYDPNRRAVLDGLDLTHGAAAVRRAGYEASGFVVRQLIELSGAAAARVVATGGGTRMRPWMQALADATGLPVEVSAVPEGAALGAAFLARIASGLETSPADAARWASTERVVEPDPAWIDAVQHRYARFVELSQGLSVKPSRATSHRRSSGP
jgi:xylulokinase